MVAEAELSLEIEQGENDPNAYDRPLPFAFAKRHGVLIQGVQDNKPLVIYKKGISPQSLAEVRRFLGTSIVFSQVDKDFFDTRLQVAYESGATKKGLYSVLDKVIKTSSRIAIAISEKI